MNETELSRVETLLDELLKKYKRNEHEDDMYRVQAVLDAKSAIRKVILSVALRGDIKDIIPIIEMGKGAGWEVTDYSNKIVRYHA